MDKLKDDLDDHKNTGESKKNSEKVSVIKSLKTLRPSTDCVMKWNLTGLTDWQSWLHYVSHDYLTCYYFPVMSYVNQDMYG